MKWHASRYICNISDSAAIHESCIRSKYLLRDGSTSARLVRWMYYLLRITPSIFKHTNISGFSMCMIKNRFSGRRHVHSIIYKNAARIIAPAARRMFADERVEAPSRFHQRLVSGGHE
jgi:hypothetical protein